jgi:hypothetical protein
MIGALFASTDTMILFTPLRTKRLAVRLREIALQEAIAICRMPVNRHEAICTEFLRFVARDAEQPTSKYIKDPRMMTVEERTLLVCHYMSQVLPSGPNFKVGEKGETYSDYVNFTDDITRDLVDMGEVQGRKYTLYPLLGIHAEALERVCTDHGEWLLGVLACCAHAEDAAPPDFQAMTDIQAMDWVNARIKTLKEMSESDIEELYGMYELSRPELHHFFQTGVDDEGILIWPQSEAKEAGKQTPARFLAVSCISEFTKRVFGGPDRAGRAAVT